MPRDANVSQPLLHDLPAPSPEKAKNTINDYQHAATLGQWEVLKFIMMTPMSCSRMTAVFLIFAGVASSAGSGITLAFYARYTGQLNVALFKKDGPSYDDAVRNLIYIIVGTMATQGLSTYCMKRIGLMKRIHLSRALHSRYFAGKKYYILNAFHSDNCDSIDSRLTSDVEIMTSEFFSILQVLIYCAVGFICSMTFIQEAELSLIGLGCLILLSVIVSVILKFISARVSSRISDLKKDDGVFSFQLTRIKKNCESIAFYGGQSLELHIVKRMFESVLRSARIVIKGQMMLDFISFFYSSLVFYNIAQWIGKQPPLSASSQPPPLYLELLEPPFHPPFNHST